MKVLLRSVSVAACVIIARIDLIVYAYICGCYEGIIHKDTFFESLIMREFFSKPFTLDRIARITFTLLIIFAVVWLLRLLTPILVPFGLAWLFAYMMMPAVLFVQHRLKVRSRLVSIIVVLLLLGGVITGIVLLLLPNIKEELHKGWELLQFYATPDTILAMLPEGLRAKIQNYTDLEQLIKTLHVERLLSTLQQFVTKGWSLVMDTVSFLMGFLVLFLFFLYLFFILTDYEALIKGFFRLTPRYYRPFVSEALHNIEYYVNSYFKGQALIALIVGVLFAIGFKLIGLPMGISLGLFLGVLNLVPYLQIVGFLPVLISAMIRAMDADQSFVVVLLLSVGVIGVVQLIQDAILTPRIHGKTMGMHPAVILLSLSIWGSLFGILGMLFALPLTMILYTYYMKYVVGEPIEKGPVIRRVHPTEATDTTL